MHRPIPDIDASLKTKRIRTMLRNLRKTALVLAVTGAMGLAAAAQAASDSPLATVSRGTQLLPGDSISGTLALSHPIHVTIALKLRNQDQLRAYDARPHQPMSRSQLAADHLPTQSQAQAVAAFLKGAGFSNVKVSDNRMLVQADGTAAIAARAFDTSLSQVRTHDGRVTFANTRDIKIPATLRDSVQAVLGLQGVHKAHTFAQPAQAAAGGIAGHDPTEFASIYGASGLKTADSVDVAVWGWGSMEQTLTDLDTFTDAHSMSPVSTNVVCTDYDGYGSGTISTTDPTCKSFDEGSVEWDMDSQDIVGMTGGVKSLTFFAAYGGYNSSVTTSLNSIVSPPDGIPLAAVINASFGECERFQDNGQGGDGSAQANDALFQIAQAQGQTFSVSTGDHGADECGDGGKNSASYPASSPYVISVAGTTLNAPNATYSRETEWIGSGGSPSSFEPAPAWQSALTYGTYKGSRGPDVAFDANPQTGAIFYNYGQLIQVGGTSLSAPIFAGAWARLIANGMVDGMTPAGQQLYAMPASYFHDVRSGNNRGYIAKRGWDWASGRGSLDLSKVPAPKIFVETYDDGTDTGQWLASLNVPRVFESGGGNPGKYLEQDDIQTHAPNWGTASPRYQPGYNDKYKIDSVFTGDWTDAGVTDLSIDMDVLQDGGWGPGRGVTLELLQMDDTGFNITYEATYTLPLGQKVPKGWRTYSFPVNADSSTIPAGWVFTHGDGTPGSDAEWSQFLKRVDLTSVGYYKPRIDYPGFGTWTVGIDNVTLKSMPPSG
jgi:xanthomonalisin